MVKYSGTQIVASEAIHWRDIAVIWQNVTRSTYSQGNPPYASTTTITYSYSLQRRDGSLFRNHLIEGKITDAKLGDHVEQMTLRYLFPEAVSTHQRGLPVPFGPLTIQPTGIEYQEQILPWYLFDSLKRGEELLITQKGQRMVWAKMSLAVIPNPALLHQLTDHIADAQQEDKGYQDCHVGPQN